ncbi:Methyltransferase domain-containing protein [Actinobaculum suis]|uniref:Methyltransferase domain-containing protein n=1 Tax=Actinobaculum suis TaxID=1657 RepID=A0A1G7DVD3_9ACTO|nr:Methyltransferase domain-containing protein [Actinobaculum suis]
MHNDYLAASPHAALPTGPQNSPHTFSSSSFSPSSPPPTTPWDGLADSFLARLEARERDHLLESLANLQIIQGGESVLDICCGPGWHLKQLAGGKNSTRNERFPQEPISRGVGIDSSAQMIALARRDCPPNLEFIHQDWAAPQVSSADAASQSADADSQSEDAGAYSAGAQSEDAGALGARKFDVVIANRCPAIQSSDDAVRMEALSTRWCVYATPIYKHVDILETILEHLPTPVPQDTSAGQARFAQVVGDLLARGRRPQLTYWHDVSTRHHTREEIKRELAMHAKQYGPGFNAAIDAAFSPTETVEIHHEMRFALAAWRVDGKAATAHLMEE